MRLGRRDEYGGYADASELTVPSPTGPTQSPSRSRIECTDMVYLRGLVGRWNALVRNARSPAPEEDRAPSHYVLRTSV